MDERADAVAERPVGPRGAASGRWQRIWRHHASVGAFAVVGLAAGVRWYGSGDLSLWLDEGLTVHFTRLPWPMVLGLEGVYVENPPLYYALTKLASSTVGELFAGRLLSVLAGTATVGVVYVLVARLVDRRAGLAAAGLLAISPLHVWYSQEARQYAFAGLAVAIAYLALLVASRSGRTAWAVVYGFALWIAMFTDYSALHALAAQPLLLVLVARRNVRTAVPLLVAAIVAALAYVPWMVQVVPTFAELGERSGYLGVTPDRLGTSLLSVAGLDGSGSYFYTIEPATTAWRRWPEFHVVLLAAPVAAGSIGLFVLARRSALAVGVGLGLLVGTVLAAIAITLLLTPAFAERTILYATLGWAVVGGSAVVAISLRTRARVAMSLVAVMSIGTVVGTSLVTLHSMVTVGEKQQWRELAADVARITSLRMPVLTFPSVTPTFFDVYRPGSLEATGTHVAADEPLDAALRSEDSTGEAAWYAYGEYAGSEARHGELEAAGYVRVMHRYYWHPLYLDLYLQPGTTLGTPIDVNGAFAGSARAAAGWTLPPEGVEVEPGVDSGRTVSLTSAGDAERQMSTSVPASANLYQLNFEVRSTLTSGAPRAFLICVAADGAWGYVYPDGGGALDIPDDGAWHPTTIAALCSAGTAHVVIDLRNAGNGTVSYRRVELRELAVPSG